MTNPPDRGKWIRTDRIENAAIRTAIENENARYRASGVPASYARVVRTFLYQRERAPPDLTLKDYSDYMEFINDTHTNSDTTQAMYVSALRSYMSFAGHPDWRELISKPTAARSTHSTPSILLPADTPIYNTVQDYATFLRNRRRAAGYVVTVDGLLRLTIAATHKHPRDWTINDEAAILAAFRARNLEGATINHYVQVIRRILRWYRPADYDRFRPDPSVPFATWDGIQENDPFRQWPAPVQVSTILDSIRNEPPWVRYALYIMSFTGLRATTVLRLTPENIDLERGFIHTKSKMGKTIHVPVHPIHLRPVLTEALENTATTLLHNNGKPIPYPTLYTTIRRIAKRITGTAFRPHDFRRFAITMLYEASGYDIVLTRDFATHDNVETTSKYLGADITRYRTKYDAIAAKLTLPAALPAGTAPALTDGQKNV